MMLIAFLAQCFQKISAEVYLGANRENRDQTGQSSASCVFSSQIVSMCKVLILSGI